MRHARPAAPLHSLAARLRACCKRQNLPKCENISPREYLISTRSREAASNFKQERERPSVDACDGRRAAATRAGAAAAGSRACAGFSAWADGPAAGSRSRVERAAHGRHLQARAVSAIAGAVPDATAAAAATGTAAATEPATDAEGLAPSVALAWQGDGAVPAALADLSQRLQAAGMIVVGPNALADAISDAPGCNELTRPDCLASIARYPAPRLLLVAEPAGDALSVVTYDTQFGARYSARRTAYRRSRPTVHRQRARPPAATGGPDSARYWPDSPAGSAHYSPAHR